MYPKRAEARESLEGERVKLESGDEAESRGQPQMVSTYAHMYDDSLSTLFTLYSFPFSLFPFYSFPYLRFTLFSFYSNY